MLVKTILTQVYHFEDKIGKKALFFNNPTKINYCKYCIVVGEVSM